MMKFPLVATTLTVLILAQSTLSFLPHRACVVSSAASSGGWVSERRDGVAVLRASVALVPEPEGGEEMTAAKAVPDCRLKKMEALPSVKSGHGDVYRFWMTAVADGNLIKETRTKLLKEASKKANFPGFRKVSGCS